MHFFRTTSALAISLLVSTIFIVGDLKTFMGNHPGLALLFTIAIWPLSFCAIFFVISPYGGFKKIGFGLIWAIIAMLGTVIVLDWNNGTGGFLPR